MELDDAAGDDEPRPPLLPPDDRLWRHPSEVAGHGLPLVQPKRRRPPRLWAVAALAGLTGALFTIALVATTGVFTDSIGNGPAVGGVALPGPTLAVGASITSPAGTTETARRVSPSVVHLEVDVVGQGTKRSAGVVFRDDGYVLTNHHLVSGGQGVTVVSAAGTRSSGRLVGFDPDTDVAVVKLDQPGAAPAPPLGSAASLEVGHHVMTVGPAPATGGEPAVAVGVVTAMGRQVARPDGPPLLDMIETNAPLAEGSSGGAVVDALGTVVGIVTDVGANAIHPGGRRYATPIDLARAVGDQIIAGEEVAPVWLGIEGSDRPPAGGDDTAPAGAVVRQVRAGSPALRSGLAAGDVITAVDQMAVRSLAGLRLLLRPHRPGDVVVLSVTRGSKSWSMKVALTERPPAP